MSDIREAYFKWLYETIKSDSRSYLKLCKYLDTRWFFIWTVPNDGNREDDAIRLREIFLDEIFAGVVNPRTSDEFLSEQVSLFEVIVALVKRIDYNVDTINDVPRLDKWFIELLRNLNISWATDAPFEFELGARGKIDNAINILLNRTYDWKGNGSFFPLREKPLKDRAKVEIWYQMMDYIAENYS